MPHDNPTYPIDDRLQEWDREAWLNITAPPEVEKWQRRYIRLFAEMQKRGSAFGAGRHA